MALRDTLRPASLEEIIGQHKAKLAVKDIVETKKPENLLLLGPVGTGKTSLALIIAKLLTGNEKSGLVEYGEPSWYHLNSEQCGNKAYVKAVIESAQSTVLNVFIFDEAHAITKNSQNLLLNALERGRTTCYIFCTTHPMKLSDALRSRCRKVLFEPLNFDDKVKLVRRGCEALGIAEPPEGFLEALETVRRSRNGSSKPLSSPRGILNALESAVSGIPVKEAIQMELPSLAFNVVRDFVNTHKRYNECKRQGICVDCARRKAKKGKSQCVPCIEATAKRAKARKKKAHDAEYEKVTLPGRSLFAVA
jgi:replication-associated recombination protein RarA